jgi:hypothetical protein
MVLIDQQGGLRSALLGLRLFLLADKKSALPPPHIRTFYDSLFDKNLP